MLKQAAVPSGSFVMQPGPASQHAAEHNSDEAPLWSLPGVPQTARGAEGYNDLLARSSRDTWELAGPSNS